MKRGLQRLLSIALASAIVTLGCSLFVQIDDSKIPVEGADAQADATETGDTTSAPSDAPDALDALDTTPERDSLPDAAPDVPQDTLTDDAVTDTSIDDTSIDAVDDGG